MWLCVGHLYISFFDQKRDTFIPKIRRYVSLLREERFMSILGVRKNIRCFVGKGIFQLLGYKKLTGY
jgi:hypothetical protein